MLIALLFLALASAGILEVLATPMIFIGLLLGVFAPNKKKDDKIGLKGIGWILFAVSVITIGALTTFASFLASWLFWLGFMLFIAAIIAIAIVAKATTLPLWAKILFVVL